VSECVSEWVSEEVCVFVLHFCFGFIFRSWQWLQCWTWATDFEWIFKKRLGKLREREFVGYWIQ
jgi:hypothetical protein